MGTCAVDIAKQLATGMYGIRARVFSFEHMGKS
jgi:hypothetical protein